MFTVKVLDPNVLVERVRAALKPMGLFVGSEVRLGECSIIVTSVSAAKQILELDVPELAGIIL